MVAKKKFTSADKVFLSMMAVTMVLYALGLFTSAIVFALSDLQSNFRRIYSELASQLTSTERNGLRRVETKNAKFESAIILV